MATETETMERQIQACVLFLKQKLYNDRNYTLPKKVIEKIDQDSLTHRKPEKPLSLLTKHFANVLQIVLLILILQAAAKKEEQTRVELKQGRRLN